MSEQTLIERLRDASDRLAMTMAESRPGNENHFNEVMKAISAIHMVVEEQQHKIDVMWAMMSADARGEVKRPGLQISGGTGFNADHLKA